ncbi:MAG: basic amino acid ABC transporter substrate-binding protein [Candidatus Desulfovibrio faecigallinarum]|nr:basic amino acid ABC transporter substrate-binding protein [Candidatus Desulfovibrio faecigallinarum]
MLKKILLPLIALFVLGIGTSAHAADKYVVATDCTFPPMEYLDNNKQPVGLDPSLIKEIAKACGFEVEVQNIAWDGIFAGVAAGRYDIVAAAVSMTPERARAFTFSDPYLDIYPTILAPAGSAFSKPEDLKGKKVGGQIGNSAIMALEKVKVGAVIREYDDVGLAIEDMVKGRIDAVAVDSVVALYYFNKKVEYKGKLRIAMQFGEPEHYAFVVKKGNKDLVEKLNKGIKLVKENGAYDRVLSEHLGSIK